MGALLHWCNPPNDMLLQKFEQTREEHPTVVVVLINY